MTDPIDEHRRTPREVIRRVRMLAVLELANVVWLPLAVYGVAELPLSPANIAGAAATGILLVQGSVYWSLKARQLVGGAPRITGLRAFRVLRMVNPVVLAAVLAVVGIALAEGAPQRALPGLLFWLLAVLEYVNYFHVQLMYDNREDLRWLRRNGFKRAHLARDLAAAAVGGRN